MIVSERYVTYLSSLAREEIPYLQEIEKEAIDNFVPIIRKDTQDFMKWMMQTIQPENILEVGTAVGFSALLMASYSPKPVSYTHLTLPTSSQV